MQHRRFIPLVAVACIALGACAGGGDQGNNEGAGTTDQSAAGSVGAPGTVTDTAGTGRDTMRDSARDTTRDTSRTGTRPRTP